MDWTEAKRKINGKISQGTHLVPTSRFRQVEKKTDEGFVVRIGRGPSSKILISLEPMLQTCFHALATTDGYNGKVFRRHFPKQATVHPCHVAVVGAIFENAGLAIRQGGRVGRWKPASAPASPAAMRARR